MQITVTCQFSKDEATAIKTAIKAYRDSPYFDKQKVGKDGNYVDEDINEEADTLDRIANQLR